MVIEKIESCKNNYSYFWKNRIAANKDGYCDYYILSNYLN